MLAGLGGFAGGLSNSIEKNRDRQQRQQQLDQQKQLTESRLRIDEREAEEYENRKKMSAEWAELMGWSPPQPGNGNPASPEAPSFSAPAERQTPSSIQLAGPIPQGGLGMMAPARGPEVPDNPAAALRPSPAPAPQAGPPMSAEEYVTKQAWTGDAFNDPERLEKMAQIAAKYGQTHVMLPYIKQAQEARERGLPEAVKFLIQGDGAAAAERLRRGGMDVRGDLTLVDKENNIWSANIGGEIRQVPLRDLIASGNPLEFAKAQDAAEERKRKNEMEERDYALKERDTAVKEADSAAGIKVKAAQVRHYDSGRAGRLGSGRADRPERIDAAIKQRYSTIDDLSSVPGDDGKPFVDPQKRLQYHAAANHFQSFLEDKFDRDLSARELHILTDHLQTFPLATGDPAKDRQAQRDWAQSLMRRYGGQASPKSQGGEAAQEVAPEAAQEAPPSPGRLDNRPAPAAPKPVAKGGLARLQEEQALKDEMNAIQRALKNPNLSPEQKQALALKAQEISQRTEAYYKGR